MTQDFDLQWIYKNKFLSQKIRDKYLSQFKDKKLLGQGFVGTTYIVVIETEEQI